MSAEPCGCDPEARWVCEQHREAPPSAPEAAPPSSLDSALLFEADLFIDRFDGNAGALKLVQLLTARLRAALASSAPTPAPHTFVESDSDVNICKVCGEFRWPPVAPPTPEPTPAPFTAPIEPAVIDPTPAKQFQAQADAILQEFDDRERTIAQQIYWRNERQQIAEILAAFYRAPLTIAAVQPILDLALKLNPDLRLKP